MNGLKIIRIQCNYSVGELAAEIGVSRQMISAWENGKKSIPESRKMQLAEYFGVEPELIGEINEQKKRDIVNRTFYRWRNDKAEHFRFKPQKEDAEEPVIWLEKKERNQRSSATTVMVVGFVYAGIINLGQAVGIIMGANIGTTVTSWIVSMSEWGEMLKPEFFAPLLVGIGAAVLMFAKDSRKKQIGEIFIGFGLLFIGLDFMSSAIKPYRLSLIHI